MKNAFLRLLKSKMFYVLLGLAVVAGTANGFVKRVKKYNDEFANYEPQTEIVPEKVTLPEKKAEVPKPEVKETPAEKAETEEVTVETAVPQTVEIVLPVQGELSAEHSEGELVYSKTMEDWRTHNGIDISADVGTAVKAAADGVIEKSGSDGMNGYCVTIKHNGFETTYKGLLKDSMPAAGTNVKAGDVIGGVGATDETEIAQEPHLHFELIKDGKSVNPLNYVSGAEMY